MAIVNLDAKIHKAIGKVLQEDVDNYLAGNNRAAWTTIDCDFHSGRLLLVKWPGQTTLDVNFSPIEAGYGDLGTLVGSVSIEYMGWMKTEKLLVAIIETYMDE